MISWAGWGEEQTNAAARHQKAEREALAVAFFQHDGIKDAAQGDDGHNFRQSLSKSEIS